MEALDCQKRKDAINERSEAIFKVYGVELNRGKCRCPFSDHDDTNPSFLARKDYKNLWYWKCQGCGKSGHDIFSFVAQMEGLDERTDFPKIVEHCEKICGIVQNDEPIKLATANTIENRPPKPIQPPMYLNAQAQGMATKVEQTNLFKYLCQYWEHTEVKRIMELYCVGLGFRLNTNSNFELTNMPVKLQKVSSCSAFPSIDTEGNTHAIKMIPYPLTDHHRAKADSTTPMMIYKPNQNPGTYFGTHLLNQDTNKPVALVESEKTAIIGTLFMPVYTWIATGSSTNFNVRMVERNGALKPRQIHIFPDSDKAEEWKATANELRALGYNIFVRDEIIKLFPTDSGTDIADVIIWEMQNSRG